MPDRALTLIILLLVLQNILYIRVQGLSPGILDGVVLRILNVLCTEFASGRSQCIYACKHFYCSEIYLFNEILDMLEK